MICLCNDHAQMTQGVRATHAVLLKRDFLFSAASYFVR
jgi:hypothetical protein